MNESFRVEVQDLDFMENRLISNDIKNLDNYGFICTRHLRNMSIKQINIHGIQKNYRRARIEGYLKIMVLRLLKQKKHIQSGKNKQKNLVMKKLIKFILIIMVLL